MPRHTSLQRHPFLYILVLLHLKIHLRTQKRKKKTKEAGNKSSASDSHSPLFAKKDFYCCWVLCALEKKNEKIGKKENPRHAFPHVLFPKECRARENSLSISPQTPTLPQRLHFNEIKKVAFLFSPFREFFFASHIFLSSLVFVLQR